MKVSGGMIMVVVKNYTYVVSYFDHYGRKIGYTTATIKDLHEMKGQKIWCGTKVHSIKVTSRGL
tara:strand:- start:1845 stop:2036 length:192 start_codon:yes stop_codon:yes gene_type:complete